MNMVDTTETLFAKQANDLAVTRMLLQMETIEQWGKVTDIDQYDTMSQALSYLADAEQLEFMAHRHIPQRWLDIVAAKSSFDRGEVYTGDTLV